LTAFYARQLAVRFAVAAYAALYRVLSR